MRTNESYNYGNIDYRLVYSAKRKTIGISVKELKVTVRAPMGTKRGTVERVLEKHRAWIEKSIEKQRARLEAMPKIDESELYSIRDAAKAYFTDKTEHYAKLMGLKYGRIMITKARQRFGSCSSKGNICFSYRLMRYPEEFREYVIVHELCHLVHMNHSKDFYNLLEKYMPDYKKRRMLVI